MSHMYPFQECSRSAVLVMLATVNEELTLSEISGLAYRNSQGQDDRTRLYKKEPEIDIAVKKGLLIKSKDGKRYKANFDRILEQIREKNIEEAKKTSGVLDWFSKALTGGNKPLYEEIFYFWEQELSRRIYLNKEVVGLMVRDKTDQFILDLFPYLLELPFFLYYLQYGGLTNQTDGGGGDYGLVDKQHRFLLYAMSQLKEYVKLVWLLEGQEAAPYTTEQLEEWQQTLKLILELSQKVYSKGKPLLLYMDLNPKDYPDLRMLQPLFRA